MLTAGLGGGDGCRFKTVINLGRDVDEDVLGRFLEGGSLPVASRVSEHDPNLVVCYRVVLSVGERRDREPPGVIRIPISPAENGLKSEGGVTPSITFSSSSLYIRAAPPPVPERRTQPRTRGPKGRGRRPLRRWRIPRSPPLSLRRGSLASSSSSSSDQMTTTTSSSSRSSMTSSHPDSIPSECCSSSSSSAPSSCEEEEEEVEDPQDRLGPLVGKLTHVGGLISSSRRKKPFSYTFSPQEYDLEQRIALEIKMREGTTKLLAACGAKGPQSSQPHTLEAAKSLLTSNERMTAYMAELQRRRASKRPNLGNCTPSLARVCLSDLRMPLLWKDIEHFKNKGDNRKFAVFVLLKIGTEIYDTVMVNPVDRSMTDICFDDVIVFNGIPPTFDCTLEVYSHLLESDMMMSNIPRKLKKTIHSSISRTVGRKLAASLRDELASGDTGPKFEMVASASLTLENISNNISTFDLTCSNVENRPDELPLFGHFCCRFAAQPDCFTQERISGQAKVPESGNFEPSWCRLYGWRLEVWESKDDAETSPHHPLALSVDRSTEVNQTSGSALQLSNNQGIDRGLLTLSFDSAEECSKWMKVLKQHISDHERWGKAAEEEMEILTPQPSRHSFIMPKRGRFTSLYEETPLRDGSPSSEKSSTDDLSDNCSFINSYCTPAPMTPRTRAFTLSTRSSFRRWGSVRANMPFFKTKS